jgi:hypothetical protein
MSLTAQPSGLVPAYHPSGEIRSIAHTGILLPGTNVAISKGQPVFLWRGTGSAQLGVTPPVGQVMLVPFNAATLSSANNTSAANTALTTQALVTAQPIYGVFAGCEYFDATNTPQESNFWPAGQVCFPGTAVTAFIWQDPLIEYTIQTDAALTVTTTIGDLYSRFDGLFGSLNQATMGNVASPPGVGLSQCTFLGTYANLVATNVVGGNLQITKLDPSILNQTPADPFVQLQVRLANPQTAARFGASI